MPRPVQAGEGVEGDTSPSVPATSIAGSIVVQVGSLPPCHDGAPGAESRAISPFLQLTGTSPGSSPCLDARARLPPRARSAREGVEGEAPPPPGYRPHPTAWSRPPSKLKERGQARMSRILSALAEAANPFVLEAATAPGVGFILGWA